MMGKPIIAGTRITIELLLRQLGQGLTVDEILENYPHLTKDDISAVMLYAANLAKEEYVYPLDFKHEKIKAFA